MECVLVEGEGCLMMMMMMVVIVDRQCRLGIVTCTQVAAYRKNKHWNIRTMVGRVPCVDDSRGSSFLFRIRACGSSSDVGSGRLSTFTLPPRYA